MEAIKNLWNLFFGETKIAPNDGIRAYDEGYKLEDNPFPKHTPNHSIWRDDWLYCDGNGKFK